MENTMAGADTRLPSYLHACEDGELRRRAGEALACLKACNLCPRRCGVDRLSDERGFCRTGRRAVVSSYGPHFGEEDPLVGSRGSGTVFFTHCNLQCCFCQNYEISQGGVGQEIGAEGLAEILLELQREGCHNINLVSPSHVVAQVLEALCLAADAGLRLPIVYNTGGYDLVETLGLLDGIVDIYMPDYKFTRSDVAAALASAPDYPDVVRFALQEMHRQVGDLALDRSGIAFRGLLVRHLVLPGGLAGTKEAMCWISRHLSGETYVNVMDQYRPCGRAWQYPELSRRITSEEYAEALEAARSCGILRLDSRRRRLAVF